MSERVDELTEAEIISALERLDKRQLDSVRFAESILDSKIGAYELAYFDPSYAHLTVEELLDGRITQATHLVAYDSVHKRYALMVNVTPYGTSVLNVDVFELERIAEDQIAGMRVDSYDVNVPTVLNGLGEFVNFLKVQD